MKRTQFGVLVFLLCVLLLTQIPFDNPSGAIFAIIGGIGLAHAFFGWLSENKSKWIWVLPMKWYNKLKNEEKVR